MNPLECSLHLFDLDDTLINTRQAYGQAQADAVKAVFPALTTRRLEGCLKRLAWFCRHFGSGNVRLYLTAFLANDTDWLEPPEDALDRMLEEYRRSFRLHLKALPGAVAFLQRLVAPHRFLALVSNGNPRVQADKLQWTGLADFFPESHRFISGHYQTSDAKPSPFLIERACRLKTVEPQQTVFYGNAVSDMLAGNLAGVTTVLCGESPDLPADAPSLAQPGYRLMDWESGFEKVVKS